MQSFYKRSSVIGCFALLLFLLIGDAIITKRQLDFQVAAGAWVVHSRQVLFELSQTESLLTDAETGQRGFLYTGEPKYLAPYNRAVAEVDPHIDELAHLTIDSARQQALVGDLRPLARAKLDELAGTIAIYRSGKPEDARKLVLADTGLVTMNQIRAVVVHMKDEEAALAESRDSDYRKSIRLTNFYLYFSTFLAVVGLILLAYYIIREMNLREKHSHEMRTREEWFRVTLTSIGDAVIATDQGGIVTFLNPVAESLTGIATADAMGKKIVQVFPIFNESTLAPVENPVAKVIEHGRSVGLANHTVLRRPDGSHTPIDDSAAPIRDDNDQLIGVVLVFRDITNDRKTERVLRNTEKLAAAARLSATVAHEINNPLAAAVNLVYISKSEPNVPAHVVKQLDMAEEELDRVAHITRQTLGFYHDSNAAEPIQLEALIQSILRLYSNKFTSKKITIERRFGKCPRIRAVQGEIRQVLSNLISNAADAVPIQGTITVILECIEMPDKTIVQMTIEDDGPGVTEELSDRIFEPFFTTKQDVGTGLGLWVTREIVERHGGSVTVNSRKDGLPGAAFAVKFNALSDAEADSQAVAD